MTQRALSALAATLILLQLAWFLLPQVEWRWLTEDEIVLSSYAALGALVNVPVWLSWTYFVVTLGVLAAMLWLGRAMRHITLVYFSVSLIVFVFFGGMVVETGLSMMLRALSNYCLGAWLAIAYFALDAAESSECQELTLSSRSENRPIL